MLKLFSFLPIALLACNAIETEPKIILGHEYNASAQVVADTASQFKANDIIVVQMDNGKPFSSSEVELRVYQGESDRIMFKRAIPVKKNDSKAVLKGPDSKPLTARDLMRTATPGPYRIAFAVGDSILLEKKLEIVK
jgi:hypothetical protein